MKFLCGMAFALVACLPPPAPVRSSFLVPDVRGGVWLEREVVGSNDLNVLYCHEEAGKVSCVSIPAPGMAVPSTPPPAPPAPSRKDTEPN